MTNTILLKRSAVPGKVPTSAQLALGELSTNTYDGKLFLKQNNGVDAVVEVATVPFVNAADALKAPLSSPVLTGVPIAPTATVSTNTTQLANTAFVLAQIANDAPTKVGVGSSGTWPISISGLAATSTTSLQLGGVAASSWALLASPSLTGIPTAPTAAVSTNTAQLATTAFVLGQAATSAPLMDGTAAIGISNLWSRQDHVHASDTTKANLASPTFTGTVNGITAAMVGLGNVSNTTDAAKPVSTQQQTALDLKATLASPALTGVPTAPTAAAATNTTQLATTAFVGAALAVAIDAPTKAGLGASGTWGINVNGSAYGVLFKDTRSVDDLPNSKPSSVLSADFKTTSALASPPPVTSNGNYSHIITTNGWDGGGSGGWPSQISTGDGLAVRQGTSGTAWGPWRTMLHDANFVAQGVAPLASPALTGIPVAPTASAGTNTTQLATTQFVGTAVANLVAASPAALDTLNELALALGNDANFSTTLTYNLALKAPLTGVGTSGNWPISITGNAATAPWSGISGKPTSLAGFGITDQVISGQASFLAANIDTVTGNGFYSQVNTGDTSAVLVFNTGNSVGPIQQRWTYSGNFEFRGKTDSANWTAWKTVVTSANISTFNAGSANTSASATRLATARTINGVAFDGTANISVGVTTSDISTAINTAGISMSNSFEKSFAISFPTATGGNAVDIILGNNAFNGILEVELSASYADANANGVIIKRFAVGVNAGNNIWNNSSRVSEAFSNTPNQFAIGEFSWDATNSRYYIPISHLTTAGTPIYMVVRGVVDVGMALILKTNLALSPIYARAAIPVNVASFIGTATSATNITIATDNASATQKFLTFNSTGGSAQPQYNSNNLSFIPSTGQLTAISYAGAGTGLTGTAAGLNIGGSSSTVTAAAQPAITTLGTLLNLKVAAGPIEFSGTNAGLEIGNVAVTNTPYIDFHSSGNNTDHDVRLIASGGLSTVGQGALQILASSLTVPSVSAGNNSNLAATTAFVTAANTFKANTASPTFTGMVSVNQIQATLNDGSGTNILVGDDVYIGDINIAATIGLKGQVNGNLGFIRFGNSTNGFGWDANNLVFGASKVWHSGNVVSPISADVNGFNNMLVASTDLNTIKTTGFYRGSALTNAPDGGWFYILVEGHDSSWTKQTVTAYGSGNVDPAGTTYVRTLFSGSTWTTWNRSFTSSNLTNLNQLTNGPGYAPVSANNTFTSQQIINSDTQTNYATAALMARSVSGDVHISLHAQGLTATSIKHQRGVPGISVLREDGVTLAPVVALTAAAGDNSNQLATTAFVRTALNGPFATNGVLRVGADVGIGYEYACNNPAAQQYYKIASLPASTMSTTDHLIIKGVLNPNWTASYSTPFEVLLGNRSGFSYKYHLDGDTNSNARIVCYLEADGSVSVYLFFLNGTFCTASFSVSGVGCTIYQTPVLTTSATGTNNFDTSNVTLYPPQRYFIGATTVIPGQLLTQGRLDVQLPLANGTQRGALTQKNSSGTQRWQLGLETDESPILWTYDTNGNYNGSVKFAGGAVNSTGGLYAPTALFTGNNWNIAVAANGATSDPYGSVSVTEPANAINHSYYGMTRAGSVGTGFGITGTNGTLGLGANAMWFGSATPAGGQVAAMGQSWIAFNSGNFVANADITSNGTVFATGSGGFAASTYAINARNPIYKFANAQAYGISYFQGSSGYGGADSIGIHFGTPTGVGSTFSFNQAGNFYAAGTINGSGAGLTGTAASLSIGGSAGSVSWAGVTSKPTTLAGYGITDAAPILSPAFSGNSAVNGKLTVTNANGPVVIALGNTTASVTSDFSAARTGAVEYSSVGSGANIQLVNSTNNTNVMLQQHSNNLQFFNFNGGSWNEKMRLAASGNLLVGTATDNNTHKLQIQGSAKVGGGGVFYNAPSLGSANVGTFAILGDNELYGLYAGVNNSSGTTWLQSQRNDATTTVYSIALNPAGGRVTIGTQADNGVNALQVNGSISGAGTGLTGTASALSIGGNAATASTVVITTDNTYATPAYITFNRGGGSSSPQYNSNNLSFIPSTGQLTATTFVGTLTGNAATATTAAASQFGTQSTAAEGQLIARCSGQNDAYLYNNAGQWGLYSGSGGTIIGFNKTNNAAFFTGNSATATNSTQLGGVAASSYALLNSSTFSGVTGFPSAVGTFSISGGTGDGASYSVFNTRIHTHWGIGIEDYAGTVRGIYDARTGIWDTLGGYRVNGALVATSAGNLVAPGGSTQIGSSAGTYCTIRFDGAMSKGTGNYGMIVKDNYRNNWDFNTVMNSGFYALEGAATNGPIAAGYGTAIVANNNDTTLQIIGGHNNDTLSFRGGSSGGASWTPWRNVLHNGNYSSYSPTLTGGNASGTWNINISGNAAQATRSNGNFYMDGNVGNQLVGAYNSALIQGVFAMGDAYKVTAAGAIGNLYGMCWSHPNAGGIAGNLDSHGMIVAINGVFASCMSYSIKASGNVTAYSDERLKTNWKAMPDSFVEKLANLKSGIYDRIDGEKLTQVGVSAQGLQKFLPEAITIASDEMGTLSVNYGGAALASAVELAKEVVLLKSKIQIYEDRLANLENLVSKLIQGQ